MEINKENSKINFSKYLPSKKMQKNLLFGFIALIIILILLLVSSKVQNIKKETDPGLSVSSNQTISEIIERDTDLDGILDWEENLWGTDLNNRKTFGINDAEYIKKRKNELNIEEQIYNKELTETERFAREFFSSFSALQTSGANSETINNFSTALGQKIADPNIPNLYSESDINIVSEDSINTWNSYYERLKSSFEEYRDSYNLGGELEIVSGNLVEYSSSNTTGGMEELFNIGSAYKEFAEKTSLISVPPSLAEIHLLIINSAHNTGVSVINMTEVINDPIVGISGITEYQRYSEQLIESVSTLEDYITSGYIPENNESTETKNYTGSTEELTGDVLLEELEKYLKENPIEGMTAEMLYGLYNSNPE